MADRPIRRAQLIAPFGVGALSVTPKGASLITGGLDAWYKKTADEENDQGIKIDEFHIREWRLEKQLHVNHFRKPPDFRINATQKYGDEDSKVNKFITIPAFRFPTWYVCNHRQCNAMRKFPPTISEAGALRCPECKSEGRVQGRTMNQVQYIVACDAGHIDDFPWIEWVHRDRETDNCEHGEQGLRLESAGSGALMDSMIKCKCGQQRPLTRTNIANDQEHTYLSSNLLNGEALWTCRGTRPWLGDNDTQQECERPVRSSFRAAGNLYFADTRSAIHLPKPKDESTQISDLLEDEKVVTLIDTSRQTGQSSEYIADILKNPDADVSIPFKKFTKQAIVEVLDEQIADIPHETDSEENKKAFRWDEYEVLRVPDNHDNDLIIKSKDIGDYGDDITKYFDKLMLVPKLREVRVLTGFSRIYPPKSLNTLQSQSLMWKDQPGAYSRASWLPASEALGEGLFFEFKQSALDKWISNKEINTRIDALIQRFNETQEERGFEPREFDAHLVMLHTFAHLLINQLAFECGYAAASLRERLYISDEPEQRMSGVLIYTASGDAQGSLGGLVRMGNPGRIEPVIRAMLEKGSWCGNDPICMEQGHPDMGGQGPDTANLAACYACALVPETSCEEFNRLLDRALLIGTPEDPALGYFHQLSV